MSRLVIAIGYQTIRATSDVRLWADVDLLLRDSSGNFVPETCRVDSATELTTFAAYRARELNLPLPINPSPIRHTQTSLEVRSGFLRFRIHGKDQTEYAVPTLFLGDPDTPPDVRQPATLPRKLLQPLALLDRLRFTAEKDPARGNPYGELVVEKV